MIGGGGTSFRGRAVAITGAASGIGLALARRFARDGARVAILDRDEAGARAAAGGLRASGADAIAVACDVTDPDACRAAIARTIEAFGGLDVLVNNAGITHRSAFADTDAAVIRRVMEVNFFGAVHCTQAALPALIARRGLVIAISSVAGFSPLIDRTGYAASKHALHGFFDSLRAEVEREGVRVLIACPSFTATGIDRSALGGRGGAASVPWAPTGGALAPEAVADAIHEAAAKGRDLVCISPVAKAAWWVSRLAPRLYARIMARTQRA